MVPGLLFRSSGSCGEEVVVVANLRRGVETTLMAAMTGRRKLCVSNNDISSSAQVNVWCKVFPRME
jgi:hypothetical protein